MLPKLKKPSFYAVLVLFALSTAHLSAQKVTDTGVSEKGETHFLYVNEKGELTCSHDEAHIEKMRRLPAVKIAESKDVIPRTEPIKPTVRTRGLPPATIQVTYTGFTPAAQAAFQAAVDIWQELISSPQVIRINAKFEALGTNVLGSAGAENFYLFTRNGVASWYPAALADAIRNTDPDPSEADLRARFNSNFANFYFGTDGIVPAGKIDFITVVMHEIGHGLGFAGSVRSVTTATTTPNPPCTGTVGSSCWGFNFGSTTYPFSYDRSVKDGSNTDIISYTNPSATILTFLQSGSVFFHGANVKAVNGNAAAKLFAPATYAAGSSYSHFDETLYPTSSPSSLMTPTLAQREVHRTPGPLGCALFKDIGWTMAGACATVLPVELSEFSAAAEGSSNKLKWITLTERNSKSFAVERSSDGAVFTEIGTVQGAGESDLPRNYFFTDETPLSISYYRLRQIDFDGKSSLSKTVSVVNNQTRPVVVYPNPAHDKLFVATDNEKTIDEVLVYDRIGRVVLRARATNVLDIAALSSGIYELKINTNGENISKRFVKQ